MSLALSARAADFAALDIPLVVLALPANGTVDDALNPLDRRSGGILRRTLERREFRGGRDELLHLSTAAAGIERLLLVGMGKAEDRVASLRRAAALAARQAVKLGVARFAFFAANITETEAEATAVGLIAGAWDFKELKTPPPADDRRDPVEEAIVLASSPDAQRGVKTGIAIGEGHSLARRLGMLPGNICTPDYLANTAREIGQRYGMTVTVLGRAEMEREKMGSFLCVAQGTPEEDPKLIVLEHRRGPRDAKPVGLVGKGLCFDSGGISIKPAQGMEWMKFDMCGAAGVLGAMETIGRLQLATNVVGFVGSTTNMPSGTAVKPGDVVQASNGKYIEIINTDAEGRLVLADVLAYAARYNPAAVIDAATLTGACVIALGHTATGVMGTDEGLVQEVLNAAKRAGEPGWPLPLWDDYKELIKSDVADIKNSGGRPAGTITAALFLKEFAEPYPWVHLDIAGTAYTESDLGTIPRGPTGVPVGTFVEFVRGRTR